MRIRQLVKDIPDLHVKGSRDIEISGVCANSKYVGPGNLFVAKKGMNFDGHRYIPDAIAAGASAVLTDVFDPSLDISQLIHPNVEDIEAVLAARCYDNPSHKLATFGVTGTNGKTTIVALLKHLLDNAGHSCGLIGTIEYIIGTHRHRATHTTPDVCQMHKMLYDMLRAKCRAAAMEVTSHALMQGRVDEIEFDVGIFTNLSPEHLDYHETMNAYAAAKAHLFMNLKPEALAVVNVDSPWHKEILRKCHAKVLRYGLRDNADIRPDNLRLDGDSSSFSISYSGEHAEFHLPLPGRYNVYNALAAIAAAHSQGISLGSLADSLRTLPTIPGRLERVPNTLGLRIYVDFAHTPDALDNALACLHELKSHRLICVFGCGGDRDKSKRPLMAQASEKWCDLCVVTSDNPRSEDPEAICHDITKGFAPSTKFLVEPDRKKAIAVALEKAEPGDIVVIAGKGHETQQIFARQTIEFSDTQVAEELCKNLAHKEVPQS